MPQFFYRGLDSEGQYVTGELEARSKIHAANQLKERNIRFDDIWLPDEDERESVENARETGADADADTLTSELSDFVDEGETQPTEEPATLKEDDFVDVAGKVAQIAITGLPLVAGLRALADEAPSKRVNRALTGLSGRLERGEPLEQILDDSSVGLPDHLRGLMRAGARSGQLAPLLERYIHYTRRGIDRRRVAWMALVYPLALLFLMSAVTVFFLVVIMPQFKEIFEDFGVELPGLTRTMIGLSDLIVNYGWVIVPGFVACVWGAWLVAGVAFGAAVRRRMFCRIPIIGSAYRYSSLSEFCHLLALLIENRVGLPEAVRLAGRGANDIDLDTSCGQIAAEMEHGVRLDDASMTGHGFPRNLIHTFRWQGRGDAFPDALHAAGEIFDGRARMQAGMIGMMCEPMSVLLIAVGIVGASTVLLMPLIKLLNDLS